MIHELGLTYEIMCRVERIAQSNNLKGLVNIGMQRGLDGNPSLFIDWYTTPQIQYCRVVLGLNLKFDDFLNLEKIVHDVCRKFELAIKIGDNRGRLGNSNDG